VVTNLESLLLRLAEKSSHVHITERGLHTEVQRTGSVAYHRDHFTEIKYLHVRIFILRAYNLDVAQILDTDLV